MSTPNPTHIIAEGMREVATEGQKGTPGTREDGQLWGAFPNTMTLTDLAAHVVSKLTDAGYSIVPTPPQTVSLVRMASRQNRRPRLAMAAIRTPPTVPNETASARAD